MTKKKTTGEYILEAKEKRTDIDFDYSKVNYVNSLTKITIIDPDFGEFNILPAHFLRGVNHPSRSGLKKPTTMEFVIKAKEKRTDIDFDYSKVNYVNNSTKVTIIDPDFGEFEIRPNNFLLGEGHPSRGKIKSLNGRTKSNKKFLTEAKEKRTDIDFDYSKVNYVNRSTKVTIIDPDFGEFDIRPSDFLRGVGHPSRTGNKKSTTVEFVIKAKEKRTDIDFDYSKVNYVNNSTKITIIDPEFGEFEIRPNSFLRGEGHPSRAKTGFDPNNSAYFYIHEITSLDSHTKFYKFGITKNFNKRLSQYNSNLLKTNKFKLFFSEDGFIIKNLESYIKYQSGIQIGVLPKELYKNGHTETISSKSLNSVMSIVYQFMEQHRNGYHIEEIIL